jgi:hydroxypyruvate reductase
MNRAALEIFREVAARIDGESLVREGMPVGPAATHVLAAGKVAFPMLAGARAAAGAPPRPTLVIAPAARVPAALPDGVEVRPADHPLPTARSVAAAEAARAFVAGCGPRAGDRLLVLLSGGASSLMCAPAPPLALDDKRAAIAAVARAGATITELNAVRKHLSSVKGGRLALATRAPVDVLALSDVVGDDPATIGSGPFSPDPTTYAEAARVLDAAAGETDAQALAAARSLLAAGARGELEETPKPGDARLAQVTYRVLAGPPRVAAEARAVAERLGFAVETLWRDTEEEVEALAAAVVELAARAAAAGVPPRAFIGNGEPRIRIPAGAGGGGRATHLALLVARGLSALPEPARARAAFLAAGTDDRDGSAPASGAVVDGGTWARAAAAGVDPEAALRAFDSYRALAAAGDAVTGPGTSNLLDLHVLIIG